jgi:membrane-associated phospholipid phosphatase
MTLIALACGPASAQTVDPVLKAPSIGEILKDVPHDLWNFFSWDTAMVLGIGGGAALAVHPWDDNFAQEVETSVRLNDAMAPGKTVGAFGIQALFGVALYSTGSIARKGRLAQTGADILRAQLLSQAYVQTLKYTVQRERPDKSNDVSFPSGHSASAFATATVLQRHYGWKAGVPATVVAGYVATARVHDNKHYLSDVIFGGAIGVAAQRTVMLRGGRYGFAVSAVPLPGGGQLSVSVRPR